MFRFNCPSCNARIEAGEDFAGKRIVCPRCEQDVAVPTNADASPDGITTPDVAQPKPARKAHDVDVDAPPLSIRDPKAKWFLRLTPGLVIGGACLCVIVPLAIALLIPAPLHMERRVSTLTQSRNNLKNIALAIHAFHDTHKRLPFNGTKPAEANDPTSGSWAFQILPYVDQAPLYAKPDANVPVPAYMCPGRGRPSIEVLIEPDGKHVNLGAWTDYFFNNYLNDPKQASKPNAPDNKRTFAGITDGGSTVLVGHGSISIKAFSEAVLVEGSCNIFRGGAAGTMRAGDNGESNPTGVNLHRDSNVAPGIGSWGGPFPQGALMAMADGTVHMFPYQTQNFGAFLTPTGNEAVVMPD